MAYRTDQPLTKAHRSTTSAPSGRDQLLSKIAGCGDPMLLKGYQERLRALPETGPVNMPADAREATAAMIEVLENRANATNDPMRQRGYQNRVRDLRQWFDRR
jgi:hypothetical protein